jgi:HAD superfamily hydrolase (TIGR01549 family)
LKNKIKHICFDLDGTLINSAETIYKSTIKTFDDLNINYSLPEKEFYKMIGMHFVDIFNQFKIDVPDFEVFISHYKKNYFDFIDASKLYEEGLDVLRYLKENSFMISLLTTKAQDQTEKILNHFNLSEYFDLIMGRSNGIPHKPSPTPLLIICKKLNTSIDSTLMVGDTELDILCGKNANAKTVAVSYGYRSVEKLKSYQPDYLIESLTELKKIIFEA